MSEHDEDSDPYIFVRHGYEFEVAWATKGFPLATFRAVDSDTWFWEIVITTLDGVLGNVLPIKIGVVRQREKRPSWPRVVHKEWHRRGTDPIPRMDELLALVHEGHFDPPEPG